MYLPGHSPGKQITCTYNSTSGTKRQRKCEKSMKIFVTGHGMTCNKSSLLHLVSQLFQDLTLFSG